MAPQPTVDDLAALVTQFEEAGLHVELTVEGDARPLPSGADLSVFRIVQEALTNTLKHAGPARAAVKVTYRPHDVLVTVSDDGRGLAEQLSRADGNGGRPVAGPRAGRHARAGGPLRRRAACRAPAGRRFRGQSPITLDCLQRV